MTTIRNIFGRCNRDVKITTDFIDPNTIDDRFDAPRIEPKAPISRTTIGSTIVNMTRVHGRLTENARKLTADIERMTEELRQNTEAVSALTIAMLRIKDDPAITDSERQAAEAAIETEVEQHVDSALDIDFSEVEGESTFAENIQALRGVEGVLRKGEV